MRVILAFDPSGAYHEFGKGTTGWCLLNRDAKAVIDFGRIAAEDYPTDMQYYAANVDVLRCMAKRYGKDLHIVIEEYLLYGQNAASHTNSRMETSQLIGILRYMAFLADVPVKMQTASLVSNRWADSVLTANKLLVNGRFPNIPDFIPCEHEIDAFRHAWHFATFGDKQPEGEPHELSRSDPRELRGGTRSVSGFIPRGFCYAEEARPWSK